MRSRPRPPVRAAIASLVIQPWAWSSTAIDPPVSASRLAGKVNGSTPQAVQATAATAVIEVVAEDARRLAFIRRRRAFDFSIEDIRSLPSLQSRAACGEARKLAEGHLATLRDRLAELAALERTITSLVSACASTCDGGAAADCVILQVKWGRPLATVGHDGHSGHFPRIGP